MAIEIRVRTRWHDRAFMRRLETANERDLGRMAAWGARRAKQTLSEPYPPASKPGEAPHRRTGRLRASVDFEQVEKYRWRWGVVFGLKYGRYLEEGTTRMDARPYLRPSLEWVIHKWRRFMKGI